MAFNRKPGCCCGCKVTFTVNCNSLHSSGATVTVTNPSTMDSVSGTTNSSGVIQLDISGIGGAGSYVVAATGGSCTGYSGSMTLVCGSSYTIACCPNCDTCILTTPFPTLFITDSSQTTACPNAGLNTWVGCYNLTIGSTAFSGCGCQKLTGGLSGCVSIFYQIQCAGADGRTLTVDRTWWTCSFGSLGFPPHGCGYCCNSFATNCSNTGSTCGDGSQWDCTSGVGQTDHGSTPLTSCSPFPFSLSLSLATYSCSDGSGGTIPSPLGAGVTINS